VSVTFAEYENVDGLRLPKKMTTRFDLPASKQQPAQVQTIEYTRCGGGPATAATLDEVFDPVKWKLDRIDGDSGDVFDVVTGEKLYNFHEREKAIIGGVEAWYRKPVFTWVVIGSIVLLAGGVMWKRRRAV
jgi:hypothetical protein